MASSAHAARATRRRRRQAALAALALAGAAAGAGALHDSPRGLVLCALVAVVAVVTGLDALRRLEVVPDRVVDAPATARAEAPLRLALLETQLDQAPVALWWASGDELAPLNNAARRLLAPGGAPVPAALLAELGEAAAASRRLVSFETERGTERGLLAARALVVEGAPARLLALMPVESELEAESLKAWRQLVHVLTHEIMNSLTPIASLSRTAHELVAERDEAAAEDELGVALEAIARRAEALAGFVGDYRRVSDWPEPVLAPVPLGPLFARLERLVEEAWRARGGATRFEVEPASLVLMADAGQLEQALLNLVANAAQATAGLARPEVTVTARLLRGGRLAIEVRDNGPGVPPGLEQAIFTPFFTTREHGHGIGLAVVRHLVLGMGGSVRHARPVSGGAAFILAF